MWEWFYSFVQGYGKRRDGTISVNDAAQNQVTVWGFRRGIPTKYSGPPMNAGQSTTAIETLEIAHEGLYMMGGAAGFAAGLANAAGALASMANFPLVLIRLLFVVPSPRRGFGCDGGRMESHPDSPNRSHFTD